MPIKGLSDQAPQFPRIGVLRKGAAKPNDRQPGADLKHFRFTDADDQATTAFKASYGDTPAAIRVLLPYSTPEQNFVAFMEEYTASSLIRRCDGETVVLQRAGVRYDRTPHACLRAQGKPCGCKQSGRLFVIIPDLKRAGFVVALTTSKHDIKNLSGQLAAAAAIVGDLAFRVPFILSRQPAKITTPTTDGKTARREKWLLNIEIDPMFVQAKLSALQRDALLQLSAPVNIPLADLDEDDEDAPGEISVTPRHAAAAVTHDEARQRYIDAVNTSVDAVGQLSQSGHETEAGALDRLISAIRVSPSEATVDQLMALADAIANATREALVGNGEAQAGALAGEGATEGQGGDHGEITDPLAQPGESQATERVKRMVAAAAARYGSRKASDAQKSLAALALREACGNDDAKRHTVQAQVFGVERFEQMTDALLLAAIDWLKPYKNGDGKYHPNAAAIQDAEAIVREALLAAGQQPLPL